MQRLLPTDKKRTQLYSQRDFTGHRSPCRSRALLEGRFDQERKQEEIPTESPFDKKVLQDTARIDKHYPNRLHRIHDGTHHQYLQRHQDERSRIPQKPLRLERPKCKTEDKDLKDRTPQNVRRVLGPKPRPSPIKRRPNYAPQNNSGPRTTEDTSPKPSPETSHTTGAQTMNNRYSLTNVLVARGRLELPSYDQAP